MNVRQRFDLALSDLAEMGIPTVLNTTSCCRSCACADVEDQSGALAFVPHGTWVTPDRLRAYDGESYDVKRLYFNFYREYVAVAREVADTFRAHGFKVEWDGSPDHCVEVVLDGDV